VTDQQDQRTADTYLYVLYDVETGEELAYHGENGDTMYRWRKDAEGRGRNVNVKRKVFK
jgi:hypothetical protein